MEKLGVSWALRKAGAMANSTTKIEDVNGDVRIASTSTGERVDFELLVFEWVPLTSTHSSLRHFLRPEVALFFSPKIRHIDTNQSLSYKSSTTMWLSKWQMSKWRVKVTDLKVARRSDRFVSKWLVEVTVEVAVLDCSKGVTIVSKWRFEVTGVELRGTLFKQTFFHFVFIVIFSLL